MKTADVKHITLTVQQLMASVLIDDEYLPLANISAHHAYRLEWLTHQITASLRVPSMVLQDNHLVAEYPDGLWQYIRKALGLKARLVQIRANEWVTFPTIAIPPMNNKPMRIYYTVEPRTVDFTKGDDE